MSSADRARYIDGLRVLASVLEAHPETPLPWDGSGTEINFMFLSGGGQRERMAATARALPCTWRKSVWGGEDGESAYFDLTGELAGLKIKLIAYRESVCRRVVVGTEDREVQEIVKPAETRTVVKPVEIVEWDCGSLLSPLPASAPKAVTA
jgi:hypothetical protein